MVIGCLLSSLYTQAQNQSQQRSTMVYSIVDSLTAEQQQQFLYYFYEAERMINESNYEDASTLIKFCYFLNPNDATINYYMGNLARMDQNAYVMLLFYKMAFDLEPNDYWYAYNFALLNFKSKKTHQKAIKNLEKVAQSNPENAGVREMLQQAYIDLGKFSNALSIQDELDSIDGYNEASAIQRYQLHMAMKDNKAALYEVERYLKIDPENYKFLATRLDLYISSKLHYTKQIEAYEALLRLDSRNPMLQNNLAWLLCIHNIDLPRAEQLSRSSILTEPRNPIYLDTYAWIAHKMGDCESAKFYIDLARKNMTQETKKEITSHYKQILRKCKK
jgi:tetratricopeptide (TPR) repeat protein